MLTKTLKMTAIALGLGIIIINLAPSANAKKKPASNCQLLKEVSTNQTKIRKEIQTGPFGNNWNTDFAVPAGVKFKSYKANMIPENNADYQVAINMKYSDDTSDVAYQRNVPMKRGQTYSLPFKSATNRQPYQINLNIGGDVGNVYNISVMACR
jgi:hypothetical protein